VTIAAAKLSSDRLSRAGWYVIAYLLSGMRTGSNKERALPSNGKLRQREALDFRPVISAEIPFADAVAAFELATDRESAMNVQLVF
jgi:hypothetical protein